jgi:hypothetical protein
MDILHAHENLKKLCNEFHVADASLTLTQVDELIEIILTMKRIPWLQHKNMRDQMRLDYCAHFPAEEQFNMQLAWGINSKSYDGFKEIIFENLKKQKSVYGTIMDAIQNDKLHLSVAECSVLPKDFIEYCIDKFERYKEPAADDDDECYDEYYNTSRPPKCTNAEIFLVNCLPHYPHEEDILAKIPLVSVPILRLMPTKYVVFEGEDLLDQLYAYYTTRELSPLLGAKRNLTVLTSNRKGEAYDYKDVRNGFVYATELNALVVEFPYLCYVYPKSVSLSVEEGAKPIRLSSWVGTDVVQLHKTYPKHEIRIFGAVQQHTCSIDDKGEPCTFVAYSIALAAVTAVGCPKVSGRAVVLV